MKDESVTTPKKIAFKKMKLRPRKVVPSQDVMHPVKIGSKIPDKIFLPPRLLTL